MNTSLTSSVTAAGASIGRQSATILAMEAVLQGRKLSLGKPRLLDADDVVAVRDQLLRYRDSLVGIYHRSATQQSDSPSRIIAILDRASTYKARTGFADRVAMLPLRERLGHIIERGHKLYLVLPMGGGKVPNPLKTGDSYLPDSSEWIALSMLSAIAEVIGEFHQPGASVVIIPDTPLHTGDLAFPEPEGFLHRRMLQRDLGALGLADHVHVVETTRYLPDEWPAEVERLGRNARVRMAADPEFAADVRAQVGALIYGQNIRSSFWSYEHSVLVNAALAGFSAHLPDDVLRDASDVYRQTERVGPHYVGVNHALRTLDIPGRVVHELSGERDYIRLTVHAKSGEPRPLLTQNSKRARPGLLPMHSVALQFHTGEGPRVANIFEVEARVFGYRPVVESANDRLLFFEELETSS